MAKTRASAKSSTSSAKLNNDFVERLHTSKGKKRSFKTVKQQPKIKNPLSAAKLQSQAEKKKIADLQANEQLLKLCRPFTICLTRIEPRRTKETSNVKSKFLLHNLL